ncbi:hypothetical protein B0H19DRAFT_1072181 [Mycena capillaripes]|nr:hypothetical protein B0H19DRAFT_1072181 [Mycena capillaripes]
MANILIIYDDRGPNKLLPKRGTLYASRAETIGANVWKWGLVNLALFIFPFVTGPLGYLGICSHTSPPSSSSLNDLIYCYYYFLLPLGVLRCPLLSTEGWEALQLVTKWLKYFRSATTQMSATKSPALSTTHAIFRSVRPRPKALTPKALAQGLASISACLRPWWKTRFGRFPPRGRQKKVHVLLHTLADMEAHADAGENSHPDKGAIEIDSDDENLLDPGISYERLKSDYSDDIDLAAELESSKRRLEIWEEPMLELWSLVNANRWSNQMQRQRQVMAGQYLVNQREDAAAMRSRSAQTKGKFNWFLPFKTFKNENRWSLTEHKPRQITPMPAKPNSNSAKWRKPFSQATRTTKAKAKKADRIGVYQYLSSGKENKIEKNSITRLRKFLEDETCSPDPLVVFQAIIRPIHLPHRVVVKNVGCGGLSHRLYYKTMQQMDKGRSDHQKIHMQQWELVMGRVPVC